MASGVSDVPYSVMLRLPHPSRRTRAGFTLIEAMIVVAMGAILLSVSMRSVAGYTQRNRVNRAAQMLTADLEQAFALAGRQRRPIRIAWNATTKTYTLQDRANSSTVFRSRPLGSSSEYKVESVTFSTTQLDVMPSGIATDTLRITLTSSGTTKVVRMTRAGLVRVL